MSVEAGAAGGLTGSMAALLRKRRCLPPPPFLPDDISLKNRFLTSEGLIGPIPVPPERGEPPVTPERMQPSRSRTPR